MMTVKPLEWFQSNSRLHHSTDGILDYWLQDEGGLGWWVVRPGDHENMLLRQRVMKPDLEAAKAAAQADYEAKVLSALTNTSEDDEALSRQALRAIRYLAESPNGREPHDRFSMIAAYCEQGLEEDARPQSAADEAGREFWLYYDDQIGRWLVQEEPFKVIRTGAEVIHAREAARSQSGDDEAPVAWLDEWGEVSTVKPAINPQPLYARPQSAAVRDGWQPIETAPKDGTPIVGYGANYVGDAAAHVTRHLGFVPGSFGYSQGRKDTWWEYVERHTCFHWEPTHWMPLPAAPALHSTQEG